MNRDVICSRESGCSLDVIGHVGELSNLGRRQREDPPCGEVLLRLPDRIEMLFCVGPRILIRDVLTKHDSRPRGTAGHLYIKPIPRLKSEVLPNLLGEMNATRVVESHCRQYP